MKPPGRHDAKLPRPRRSPRASGKQSCHLCVVETWTLQRPPLRGVPTPSSLVSVAADGGCVSILCSVCVASPSHTLCPRIESRALSPSCSLFCWLRRRAMPWLTNACRLVRITLAKGERRRLDCASLLAVEAANPSEPVHLPSRPESERADGWHCTSLRVFALPTNFGRGAARAQVLVSADATRNPPLVLGSTRVRVVLLAPRFQGGRGRFLFFFFCFFFSFFLSRRVGVARTFLWIGTAGCLRACVRACVWLAAAFVLRRLISHVTSRLHAHHRLS
jgi:hypothetical protein